MYAPIQGTGDGSAPVVPITFDYLNKAHVKASAGGASVGITFTGASEVTFVNPVAAGVPWKVYRETPSDNSLVDFTDGSVLTEADLDLGRLQTLYVAQELDATVNEFLTEGVNISVGVGDVSGLQAALDAKADDSDITTLQTAINGKQAAGDYALNSALTSKLDIGDILAGANVTVTNNGNGTLTIAAAGGGSGGATLADGDYGDISVSNFGTTMTVKPLAISKVSGLQAALDTKITAPAAGTVLDLALGVDLHYPDGNTDDSNVRMVVSPLNGGYVLDVAAGQGIRLNGVALVDANALATKASTTDLNSGLAARAPAVSWVVGGVLTDVDLADGANGQYIIFAGTSPRTLTLGSGHTTGMSAVVVNRSSANLTVNSFGMFKNNVATLATTGTVAPGGSIVVFMEDVYWSVRGDIT